MNARIPCLVPLFARRTTSQGMDNYEPPEHNLANAYRCWTAERDLDEEADYAPVITPVITQYREKFPVPAADDTVEFEALLAMVAKQLNDDEQELYGDGEDDGEDHVDDDEAAAAERARRRDLIDQVTNDVNEFLDAVYTFCIVHSRILDEGDWVCSNCGTLLHPPSPNEDGESDDGASEDGESDDEDDDQTRDDRHSLMENIRENMGAQ